MLKNLKASSGITNTIINSEKPRARGNVNCLGYVIAETYRNGQKFLFRIHVVAGKDQANLLNRGASSAFKLVKRIDDIPDTVFGRTGLINCEPIKTELKPDA